ncbi:MAG: RdgB/HAM1 family non-canonical purine NTP pyrophosphatase [Bacteroidota bacterium]|nr:RdgB/HAM1 family non-canonical purine NTP pyrophosphatase [Bacteroidota bacterium]
MTMKQLIFATHNQHKLNEVQQLVPEWLKIISLIEAGYQKEIPETGDTFRQNALNKSYYVWREIKEDLFAEDSGLSVQALNNAPGVFSARYAGEKATDAENVTKLLQQLEGVEDRTAEFTTIISLIYNGKKWEFEGTMRGTIATVASGSSGFGYDPIFIPIGQEKSLAELGQDFKNKISHRAIAVHKMLDYLTDRELGISLMYQGKFA